MVVHISNIQITTAINSNTSRIAHLSTSRRSTITTITIGPVTRDRVNDTALIHFTDAVVILISNIQIATTIDSNVNGVAKLCIGRSTTIATITIFISTSYRTCIAIGVHFMDLILSGISNIEIATTIDGYTSRFVKVYIVSRHPFTRYRGDNIRLDR